MTFKYRYRKQILIIVLLLIVIGGITTRTILMKNKKVKNKDTTIITTKNNSLKKTVKKIDNQETYKVDIKGEINSPGIYSLESDKRVIDQTCFDMIRINKAEFEINPVIPIII